MASDLCFFLRCWFTTGVDVINRRLSAAGYVASVFITYFEA